MEHRTYPAESSLLAGLGAGVVDAVAAVFLPDVGPLGWVMFPALTAAVSVPIYKLRMSAAWLRDVKVPSLSQSWSDLLGATAQDYESAPEPDHGPEPGRVVSRRRDTHRLE